MILLKQPTYLFLAVSVSWLSGCFNGPGLFKQDESATAINIEAVEAGGVTSGAIMSGSTSTQQLSATAGTMSGTKVSFPPGSLSIDTNISIQPGADITGNGMAGKLGLKNNKISAAGPAVVLNSSKAVDASKPFTLEIPLNQSSLYLAAQNIIVMYKIEHAKDNEVMIGLIPTADLVIGEGIVRFETKHFGAYQAGVSEEKIKDAVEAKSDTPILTQSDMKAMESMDWNWVEPALDTSTRKVTFAASASGFAKLVFCAVSIFNDADDSLMDSQTFKDITGTALPESIYTAEDTADSYSVYAIYMCEDKKGRFEESPKSDAILIPGVASSATPTPTPTPTPEIVPGACSVEDSDFVTSSGGCKDTATNLVWSNISPNSMSWHDAVWDQNFGGNVSTQDANDYGRTNDYVPGSGCTGSCDSSTVNYCHDLIEGGYSDWRLPSTGEFSIASSHGAGTHFAGATSQSFWTSESWGSTAASYPLPSGASASTPKGNNLYVYCVRGGYGPISAVGIYDAPTAIVAGVVSQPIKIKMVDSNGVPVNAQNLAVSLTAAGPGNLLGTVTGNTDVNGRLSIQGYTYDQAGTIVLAAAVAGLTTATRTIAVTSATGMHVCQTNDGVFATADGGCKDLVNGLVWSLPSSGTWHEAIWDQATSGNTGSAETSDGGRTNDYDQDPSIPVGTLDTSYVDYCHELSEGGFTDWRVPTYIENSPSYANASEVTTYFDPTFPAGYFWSSSSVINNTTYVYTRDFRTGAESSHLKTTTINIVCVRGG